VGSGTASGGITGRIWYCEWWYTTHSTRSLLFIPSLTVPDPTCLYHHSQYQILPVYTTTHSTRSHLFIPPLTVPDPSCLYHHSQYQIPPVYTNTHSTRSHLFIPTLIVPDPSCYTTTHCTRSLRRDVVL
jgi:hypothetical protein